MGRRAPAVGEPLAQPAVGQPRARIAVVDGEHQGSRDVAALGQGAVDEGPEGAVEPLGRRRRAAPDPVLAVVAVGDIVLVIDPVGDVDVDIEVRPIPLEEGHQGPHLRLVQLHEVAVQVLVGRGVAPALDARTALVRPRIGARALVAVDRQDRDQDQVDAVQQVVAAVEGDVAQQHHARVLAVDLARVNPGLGDQERLGRIEFGAVARGDDGVDRPALRRGPELLAAAQVRRRVQPVEPGASVGVVRAEVMLRIGLEAGHPRIGRRAQQVAALSVPLGRRRQEGPVPRGGVGAVGIMGLGHDGARDQRQKDNQGRGHRPFEGGGQGRASCRVAAALA